MNYSHSTTSYCTFLLLIDQLGKIEVSDVYTRKMKRTRKREEIREKEEEKAGEVTSTGGRVGGLQNSSMTVLFQTRF